MGALETYRGKKVLVTGHTGFKGSWLSIWLTMLGAKVIGFSLPKSDNDFIFTKSGLTKNIIDERGDIMDLKVLSQTFDKYKPDMVFHLAAQPIVRRSYKEPLMTMNTNIIGCIHIIECLRTSESAKAAILVTSDKCYKNKENNDGYSEKDEIGGTDPYSASKACAEIVIGSYRSSFFSDSEKLIATVRAGNVIGGGDFAEDRLIPDCIKSLQMKETIKIRNPKSVRPWQHVLDPLMGYLMLGEKLMQGKKEFAEAWNFAPEKNSMITVQEVVEQIIRTWGKGKWETDHEENKPHETNLLYLKSEKAKKMLNWHPKWGIEKSIQKTIEWYKNSEQQDVFELCTKQIDEYNRDIAE